MLLSRAWSAAASAIGVCALAVSAAAGSWTPDGAQQDQRGSSGGSGAADRAPEFARVDTGGLGSILRFRPSPAMLRDRPPEAPRAAQELILVPLPAPLWVAGSGLSGLAIVAAWRRHKLRAEQ